MATDSSNASYASVDYKHYRARRLIGRGGYGDVILCERKEDAPTITRQEQSLVALKRVKRAESDEEDEVLREQSVRREASILQSLRHPYIVESFFTVKRANFIYLGLEYCPGGDLFTLFYQEIALSKQQASKHLIEIALALDYLHVRGIIHRDVKPENVVLKGGCCKLIDFGNACVLENPDDKVVTTSGTMPYTAPEILERTPHRFEVDWWSFGVIACEMLTHTSPFGNTDTTSNNDLCNAICTEPAMISNEVDPVTFDLLAQLLQKSRTRRLGYAGLREVKSHKFFDRSLWKSVVDTTNRKLTRHEATTETVLLIE